MKSKWYYIFLILQLIIAFFAVIAFFVLLYTGEDMLRFIPAFVFSLALLVVGIWELLETIKSNRKER